jgi:hypothetical protein
MPRGQRAQKNPDASESEATKRPRRSPSQKAQDDLEAARKRLVKANDAYEEAQAKAQEAKDEYERSVKIFDHASHHPDLEQPADAESEEGNPVEEHMASDDSDWDEAHEHEFEDAEA